MTVEELVKTCEGSEREDFVLKCAGGTTVYKWYYDSVRNILYAFTIEGRKEKLERIKRKDNKCNKE